MIEIYYPRQLFNAASQAAQLASISDKSELIRYTVHFLYFTSFPNLFLREPRIAIHFEASHYNYLNFNNSNFYFT